MKRYIGLFILMITMLVLGGCEQHDQYTEEELLQICIVDYSERNLPELTYAVKEKYETVEETYQEIISLYVWEEEKEVEVFDSFSYDKIQNDPITQEYVESENLDWYDVKDGLYKKQDKYQEILLTNFIDTLLKILDVSNEEVHNNFPEIEDAILNEGFNHIIRIEYERKHKDYQDMFFKCSTKFMREMYYVLYPEEMLQGALENIYQPVEIEDVESAKTFLQEIGKYETYAEDVENALAKFNKSDEFNGNSGGLDLGIKEESDDDDYEVKPSEKEPEEEPKKELPYDPYDVYDYWDPEDFYYDWEDDFDGYEDAEDYWYEAWEAIE